MYTEIVLLDCEEKQSDCVFWNKPLDMLYLFSDYFGRSWLLLMKFSNNNIMNTFSVLKPSDWNKSFQGDSYQALPIAVQLNTLIPLVFPFKRINKLFRLLFNIQTIVTFSKYLVASEVILWEVKRYLACIEINNQGSMAQHYVENKSQ